MIGKKFKEKSAPETKNVVEADVECGHE